MASHLSYLVGYYNHLYTVTGGTLRFESEVIQLFRVDCYQLTLDAVWNAKRYAGAYRIRIEDVYGHDPGPNHPLLYQAAVMLRELCKSLEYAGCDYATLMEKKDNGPSH